MKNHLIKFLRAIKKDQLLGLVREIIDENIPIGYEDIKTGKRIKNNIKLKYKTGKEYLMEIKITEA